MLTVVAITETHTMWEAPPTPPLDEARWQAWMQRGVARDVLNHAVRLKAVKGICVATLLAGAVLWFNVAPFAFALQGIVTAGSLFVMWQAIQERRFTFAAVLGALALLYNPVVPLVHAFGGWQRAAMVASTIPFVLSLDWRKRGKAHKGVE